jgi:hypothetical protein
MWYMFMNELQSLKISESENKRYAALIDANHELLEDLIHDNLIYIHSNGVKENKHEFISNIASKKYQYLRMKREDELIRTMGSFGIITGIGNFETILKGKFHEVRVHFHSIWVHNGNDWKFYSWQATKYK